MSIPRLSLALRIGASFLLPGHATIMAQYSRSSDSAAAATGCAFCGSVLVIPIIIIVLNIVLLVWVARDAKARGMDNAVLWMLLVMCTSVIGLIIYLSSRPQGNLVQCVSCRNNRLQVSARCPHCGNA